MREISQINITPLGETFEIADTKARSNIENLKENMFSRETEVYNTSEVFRQLGDSEKHDVSVYDAFEYMPWLSEGKYRLKNNNSYLKLYSDYLDLLVFNASPNNVTHILIPAGINDIDIQDEYVYYIRNYSVTQDPENPDDAKRQLITCSKWTLYSSATEAMRGTLKNPIEVTKEELDKTWKPGWYICQLNLSYEDYGKPRHLIRVTNHYDLDDCYFITQTLYAVNGNGYQYRNAYTFGGDVDFSNVLEKKSFTDWQNVSYTTDNILDFDAKTRGTFQNPFKITQIESLDTAKTPGVYYFDFGETSSECILATDASDIDVGNTNRRYINHCYMLVTTGSGDFSKAETTIYQKIWAFYEGDMMECSRCIKSDGEMTEWCCMTKDAYIVALEKRTKALEDRLGS